MGTEDENEGDVLFLYFFLCIGLKYYGCIFHGKLASSVLELHISNIHHVEDGGYFAQVKSTALQRLATL